MKKKKRTAKIALNLAMKALVESDTALRELTKGSSLVSIGNATEYIHDYAHEKGWIECTCKDGVKK